MPPDAPGTVSETDALAIVSYILQQNGQPAGAAPAENANQLNNLKLVRPR